jgi:hypothetical protein
MALDAEMAAALEAFAVSDRLRRWLDSLDGDVEGDDVDDDVDIFQELDELHDQRVERRDAKWFPADGDLARLVRERRARGKSSNL